MDGFLLIDKSAGLTSHDVVDAVRRVAKTRRVGHAGTLDPFATGLLILGIGKATKKLGALAGLDKTYDATARLGATSTTDDPEGVISVGAGSPRPAGHDEGCHHEDQSQTAADEIVQRHPQQGGETPPLRNIEQAISRFRGSYLQTAPTYSAKKIGGKKLYELARQGRTHEIELPKKTVTITELVILDYTWPDLAFRVSCSSGTYIRALARDIGQALGTGAYLMALRRTRIGTHHVRQAIVLDELTTDALRERLVPV